MNDVHPQLRVDIVAKSENKSFWSSFLQKARRFQRQSLWLLVATSEKLLSFKRIFESVKTFCKRKSFHKLPDCTDHPRKVPGGKFSEVETDVGLCDNKSLSYFYINIASRIQVSAVKNHPLDNF